VFSAARIYNYNIESKRIRVLTSRRGDKLADKASRRGLSNSVGKDVKWELKEINNSCFLEDAKRSQKESGKEI
jgi:hypothetical protein